ncbi:MAG: hypothetical protein KGN84_17170 [Acidobacteriota bacterium]|nr:hypothetical protein [Acidobacteriota bacterium]
MALFAIAALGGTAYVLQIKPVYEAEAMILVESQKIPENYVAATVQTALEARLESLKEQVLSNQRLWELITTYNLYPDLRAKKTRDELLDRMRKDIGIVLERSWSGSRPAAFRISFDAGSPQVAADVTNRVSRFFVQGNLAQREQEAVATSHFLDAEMADSKQRLEEQEARLSSFKVANTGELPEQSASLLSSIAQGRTELIGIQDATARAHQNILVLQGSLSAAEESARALQARERLAQGEVLNPVTGVPAPRTPEQKLEADLKDLRARYQEAHPDVQRAERALEAAREQDSGREAAADAATPTAAPVRSYPAKDETSDSLLLNAKLTAENVKTQIAVAQREITDLEARRKEVLKDLDDAQASLQRVPVREQELAAITRDYDASKANYQSLLRKKMDADVAADMERGQKAERFLLLNSARPPEKPERPKKPLLFAIAGLGSAVFAFLCALALEARKNVVLGEWELPKRVPILGYMPAIEGSQDLGLCH